MDSDEEEEKKATEANDNNKDKNEDVMDDEEIEGQEDETIREDDGIKVTPFNLKDEMEEGIMMFLFLFLSKYFSNSITSITCFSNLCNLNF